MMLLEGISGSVATASVLAAAADLLVNGPRYAEYAPLLIFVAMGAGVIAMVLAAMSSPPPSRVKERSRFR